MSGLESNGRMSYAFDIWPLFYPLARLSKRRYPQ